MIEKDKDEDCPIIPLLGSLLAPKFLGLDWDYSMMVSFLKKRGYLMIDRVSNALDGLYYQVAVKPDSKVIPEEDNIKETFDKEVQTLILGWLEKL